jgi:hypothetical protein
MNTAPYVSLLRHISLTAKEHPQSAALATRDIMELLHRNKQVLEILRQTPWDLANGWVDRSLESIQSAIDVLDAA